MNVAARGDETQQSEAYAPFAEYFVHEVAFDEPLVELVPPQEPSSSRNTANGTQQPDASETTLAERVEALERYIRDMEAKQPAEEPLPEGKENKEAKKEEPTPECKEVEIITKPVFTPLGRIYVDGVTYDDDPETAAFFNTDRDNEFGFRTFRIGGRGYIWENLFYTLEFEIRGTNTAITIKTFTWNSRTFRTWGTSGQGTSRSLLAWRSLAATCSTRSWKSRLRRRHSAPAGILAS
jgi:hypothetical protein